MRDDDLLLPGETAEFGSGVIGVCDVCHKRQAVIVLEKERFKLCVIDFLNKTWIGVKSPPGAPLPPYRSERVWFPTTETSTGRAPGIVLTPTKEVKHPLVLITPDVYGLTATLLDAAIRCARAGFEVLLPDVQKSGAVGVSHHLAMRRGAASGNGVNLDHPKVREMLRLYRDGLTYLRSREMVDVDKAAVLGASYGGSLALGVAAQDPGVVAVVVAYPLRVAPAESLRLINAPVLYIGAGRDRDGRKSERQFRELADVRSARVEFLIAPEASGHFLSREHRAYRVKDAEDAWARIDAFLKDRLLPPTVRPPTAPTPPVRSATPAAAPALEPAAQVARP